MNCNCFTCPLGKSSYEKQLSICNDLYEVPDSYGIAWNIWCDKIGGKCGWYGHCDEAFEKEYIEQNNNNKSKSTKRTRKDKYIKRLKYLSEICGYPPPSYHIKEKWDKELRCYIPVEKSYYKRLYRGNHKTNRYKYYKKYSNKSVRRYGLGSMIESIDWYGGNDYYDFIIYGGNKHHGELKNGGSYKKVFDYWWTVD